MSQDNESPNLFDFFGFPSRQQRDETLYICDVNKLRLMPLENDSLWFFDPNFKQYKIWSIDINNFSSHLWLHFLLMYYQYIQNPFDTKNIKKFQYPQGAHKVFFDTFAEDVSLYAISYFDKHLEMFNVLYDLQKRSGNKRKLSRGQIIV